MRSARRWRRRFRASVSALAFCSVAGLATAQTPASARAQLPLASSTGVEERLEQPAVLAPALVRASVATGSLPLFVQLDVPWAAVRTAATSGQWAAFDQRLDAYARTSVPVMLSIEGAPDDAQQTDEWRENLRAVAEHLKGKVAGYRIQAIGSPVEVATYAFLLKIAAVQLRAVDPTLLIAQTGVGAADVAWQSALYAEGTAPYTDIVPITTEVSVTRPLTAVIADRDPTAGLLWTGVALGQGVSPGQRWLASVFEHVDANGMSGSLFSGTVDQVVSALGAAGQLADILHGELTALDEGAVGLKLEQNGSDVTSSLPHRLLFNATNAATYLVFWNDAASSTDTVTVTMADQTGRGATLRDAAARTTTPSLPVSWDASTKMARLRSKTSRTPLVLDFNYGAENLFATRTQVTAKAGPSVEEILVRNQQAQAAQDGLYQTVDAALRIQLHFRATVALIFDIISDNRFFKSRDSVEWAELTFSVNGAKWGPDHPGVPLLQAEKVATLPLDLRLTNDYRYHLDGTETVGEHECYVVSFEPIDASAARYRGRVWIDTRSFVRMKLDSIQTNLRGDIVSNEEISTYEPVASKADKPIYFATRVTTKQLILFGGRTLLLEKENWFSDFHVDSPTFVADRDQMRASNRVMFRDTDAGVRYLVKDGGTRVVSNVLKHSSRAMVMGTTIDPTFAFPLPVLGLNYLNFAFPTANSQFALLFGGVFAALNVQVPKLGRTPFDASVDFFGIAVPGSDIRFTAAGELRGQRLFTIPVSTGANVGYQFTPFQKVGASYSYRYDKFFADPNNTAEDFVPPVSTSTHGLSAGYEFKRHGYGAGLSASTLRRASWAPWGLPSDPFDAATQRYIRYSVSGSKDFLLGPFQSVHAGGAWYSGRRLDRFSMYQFGLFDELRMHGVPSSGIRFGSLALFHASYSFNLLDVYKIDLFLDQAFGRDPEDPAVWRPVTGTGIAVNLKAPWNTMFSADVGKGFLPALYRPAGSFVLQLMLIKPL